MNVTDQLIVLSDIAQLLIFFFDLKSDLEMRWVGHEYISDLID